MELVGKIQIKITNKQGQPLNEEVEIRLTHRVLSHQTQPMKVITAKVIEITGLHTFCIQVSG